MFSYSALQDLIDGLEEGNKFHITVRFFPGFGNAKTEVRWENSVHAVPFCDASKRQVLGLRRCLICKAMTVRKADECRRSFAGNCINGVYEYCHPVFLKEELCCIIYIGNIIRDREEFCKKNGLQPEDPILDTMELHFDEKLYPRLGALLESYIRMLFEQYPESNREKSRYAVVPQVRRYVDRYYFLELSLSQLARIYHYNEKYLGRLFKQQVGLSFNEYLNEKRLEYGKERLLRSKDSVLDISANAGFRNVTYFNRMFKRRYGVSPTQYRRERVHNG